MQKCGVTVICLRATSRKHVKLLKTDVYTLYIMNIKFVFPNRIGKNLSKFRC